MNLSNPSTAILKTLQYVRLVILHGLSKQKFERIPEPFNLTEQELHVEDYSKAIDSVMILPYVLVLDMVRRIRGPAKVKTAMDLCCGPGHFTRMLAQHLACEQVTGVDLSEPMLLKARQNAQRENLAGNTHYVKSDVADLRDIAANSMDVVSFMDGAHHMASIETVASILKEADRVAKADGLIIMIDPVKPKTETTANLYHRIAGKPYLDKGLIYFDKDFYDSILASWSFDELFAAIPKTTGRKWVQLIPFGFPAFQIIIGLPEGREDLYIGEGLPGHVLSELIPAEGKSDWALLKLSFRMARQRIFRASAK